MKSAQKAKYYLYCALFLVKNFIGLRHVFEAIFPQESLTIVNQSRDMLSEPFHFLLNVLRYLVRQFLRSGAHNHDLQ